MSKIVETVKANPVVSTLTAFILVMSTVTGTLTATGQLDSLVVTEAELSEFVADVGETKEAIDDLKLWNRCDRLERRIDQLDDLIWRLEGVEDPDEDAIREAERRQQATEREYNALECARILAG